MKQRLTVGEEIAGTLAIFAALGLMLLGMIKLSEIAYGDDPTTQCQDR